MDDKLAALRSAGISCGEDCSCVLALAEVLSDEQVNLVCQPAFKELIESGVIELIGHIMMKRQLLDAMGAHLMLMAGEYGRFEDDDRPSDDSGVGAEPYAMSAFDDPLPRDTAAEPLS